MKKVGSELCKNSSGQRVGQVAFPVPIDVAD